MSRLTYARYELKALLESLRRDGIAVGELELERLASVIDRAEPRSDDDLRQILACTLVKDARQLRRFERHFSAWCRGADRALRDDGEAATAGSEARQPPAPSSGPKSGSVPHDRRPARLGARRTGVALLVLAALLGGISTYRKSTPVSPTHPTSSTADVLADDAVERTTHESSFQRRVRRYDLWAPEIVEIQRSRRSATPVSPAVGVGMLAGLLVLLLTAFHYIARRALPVPLPPPSDGPSWLPTTGTGTTRPGLLDGRALSRIVWGVEKFVSDQASSRLDVPATVLKTARAAGIPTVVYQRRVRPREVWIWNDVLVDDPMAARMADELGRALEREALPVRLGRFSGVPELIQWVDGGSPVSPLALEGRRPSVRVAILTTGEQLVRSLEQEREAPKVRALLYRLSQWSHLAFVDTADGAYGLGAALEELGLSWMFPAQLPAFVGGIGGLRTEGLGPVPYVVGDLKAWAAALALSDDPVDMDTALSLRERLGIRLPPTAVRELFRGARCYGHRFRWSDDERSYLLSWLARVERNPRGGIPGDGVLARALSFWEERYLRERGDRADRVPGARADDGTLASRRLMASIAWLRLWRYPERGARELYRVFSGPLAEEIRRQLARCVDSDLYLRQVRGSPLLGFPWRWSELRPSTRALLSRMGFGTASSALPAVGSASRLQPIVLGGCTGVLLASAAIALLQPPALQNAPRVHYLQPEKEVSAFRSQTIVRFSRTAEDDFDVAVGTARRLTTLRAPADSDVYVRWSWTASEGDHPRPIPGSDSHLWSAGTLPQPIRGCEEGWPERSLVAIEWPREDDRAVRLAVRLLDRGSADAVLLGADATEHLDALIALPMSLTTRDQLVVLTAGKGSSRLPPPAGFRGTYARIDAADLSLLADRMSFSGHRPLAEAWGEVGRIERRGPTEPLLRGGPALWVDPETGIPFLEVCGGTFTMGSDPEETNAVRDEWPRHPVTLSTFWMARHETTLGELGEGASGAGASWPATSVSYEQARESCEKRNYRLPTEAQWEYAARAGSTDPWPFESRHELGRRVWFDETSRGGAQLVELSVPNPLGLYDMHGNVWEWCADTYAAYQDGHAVDPRQTGRGEAHVLRGGSWGRPWHETSSAVRGRMTAVSPRGRGHGDQVGFRCVR